jgi:dipeptide/tripeptide permease
MKKFPTHFAQTFHKIFTVKKCLKTNRDAVIAIFSTKYRPPIYYYISKRSLTLLNFCLDNGVHFNIRDS